PRKARQGARYRAAPDLRGGQRLYGQRPHRRGARADVARRVPLRGRTAPPAARAPGSFAHARSLFLEERQGAHRPLLQRQGQARILGDTRLSQPRGPMERGAVWLSPPSEREEARVSHGEHGSGPSIAISGTSRWG